MKLRITSFLSLAGASGLLLLGSAGKAGAQYCSPSTTYGCGYANIESFSTTGGLVNITNNGTGCGSGDYTDNSATMSHTAVQGDPVNFSFEHSTGSNPWGPECGVKIWVDWNIDGDFDDMDELVYESGAPGSYTYISAGVATTGSFNVPLTATVGTSRIRIRAMYYSNDFDPCATPSYSEGEAEDYGFVIIPLAPPDNAGIDSLVNPAMNGQFCSGNQEVKVRLRNLGKNGLNSVNIHWSIDGIEQTSTTYNNPVDSIASPDNWAIVSLGTVNFPYNAPVTIKSWTSMPNGVTDSDFSDDTLTVTVISGMQNVDVQIMPGDTAFCAGDFVVLDAGVQPPGCLYVWSTGALSQTISVPQAGTYYVKVQSLQGCSNRDTVTILELPQPVAGGLAVVDDGDDHYTFTITGVQNIETYAWDFGDGNYDSGPGPKAHQYTDPGLYVTTVTVSNSCNSITLSAQIQVEPPTGISGPGAWQQAIRLYPNPARDQVFLKAAGALNFNRVTVYNVLGAAVYAVSLQGSSATISTAELAQGIYQVVIDTDQGTAVKKLEIIK